jgi:hypothetical protein
MLYTHREQNPRMGDPRAAADERRAFSRRIDCDGTGRSAQPVNPSAGLDRRDAQAGGGRRRLDID